MITGLTIKWNIEDLGYKLCQWKYYYQKGIWQNDII